MNFIVVFYAVKRCWSVNVKSALEVIREFQQITTAGATTAAVTEKVWGEYVSVVCQILARRNTKISGT